MKKRTHELKKSLIFFFADFEILKISPYSLLYLLRLNSKLVLANIIT